MFTITCLVGVRYDVELMKLWVRKSGWGGSFIRRRWNWAYAHITHTKQEKRHSLYRGRHVTICGEIWSPCYAITWSPSHHRVSLWHAIVCHSVCHMNMCFAIAPWMCWIIASYLTVIPLYEAIQAISLQITDHYRYTLVTSYFWKVCHIFTRLLDKNFIFEKQFGFLPFYSTTSQTLISERPPLRMNWRYPQRSGEGLYLHVSPQKLLILHQFRSIDENSLLRYFRKTPTIDWKLSNWKEIRNQVSYCAFHWIPSM